MDALRFGSVSRFDQDDDICIHPDDYAAGMDAFRESRGCPGPFAAARAPCVGDALWEAEGVMYDPNINHVFQRNAVALEGMPVEGGGAPEKESHWGCYIHDRVELEVLLQPRLRHKAFMEHGGTDSGSPKKGSKKKKKESDAGSGEGARKAEALRLPERTIALCPAFSFRVPRGAEAWLSRIYGPSWRVPQHNKHATGVRDFGCSVFDDHALPYLEHPRAFWASNFAAAAAVVVTAAVSLRHAATSAALPAPTKGAISFLGRRDPQTMA